VETITSCLENKISIIEDSDFIGTSSEYMMDAGFQLLKYGSFITLPVFFFEFALFSKTRSSGRVDL
jgi:hypothetical protein